MAQSINEQGGLIVLNPIQIADEDIYNTVMDIIEHDPDIRTAESFAHINDNVPDNFIMAPVHSAHDPILVDESHIALLWRDQDEPDNPDMMAAIILEIVDRGDGTFKKSPCGIIVGNEFQGVLQYRCPCCGDNDSGFSMMFFIMNDAGKIEYTTRDTLVTKRDEKRMFESVPQGVTVSSHDIAHILHHHNNAGQSCGHDHRALPKTVQNQKLALR